MAELNRDRGTLRSRSTIIPPNPDKRAGSHVGATASAAQIRTNKLTPRYEMPASDQAHLDLILVLLHEASLL
jgi:hypothetical protein